MKAKIQQWVQEIQSITEGFVREFGALKPKDLNWQPNAHTWSIAQVMDHLVTINSTYFPVIEQVKQGKYSLPFIARFSFVTNFFGNIIEKGVAPDRKRKTKTFSIWEPRQGEIDNAIIERFQAHQQELIRVIQESEDLLDRHTIISSPANKNIVYSLEKAFDIIVTHEKRHFNQAVELLSIKKKLAAG